MSHTTNHRIRRLAALSALRGRRRVVTRFNGFNIPGKNDGGDSNGDGGTPPKPEDSSSSDSSKNDGADGGDGGDGGDGDDDTTIELTQAQLSGMTGKAADKARRSELKKLARAHGISADELDDVLAAGVAARKGSGSGEPPKNDPPKNDDTDGSAAGLRAEFQSMIDQMKADHAAEIAKVRDGSKRDDIRDQLATAIADKTVLGKKVAARLAMSADLPLDTDADDIEDFVASLIEDDPDIAKRPGGTGGGDGQGRSGVAGSGSTQPPPNPTPAMSALDKGAARAKDSLNGGDRRSPIERVNAIK